jgi:RHS repeat-associated protein
MKNCKYLFLLLVLLASNRHVFGAIERFSSRMDGDHPTTPLTAGSSFNLQEDKYYDMSTDPFWSTRFANKKATGTVRLGINPDLALTAGFSGTQTIEIKYWTWNAGTGAFVMTSTTKVFSLSYSTSGTTNVDDQSTFTIDGAHRIAVRLMSGTLPLDKLFLETTVEIERYYVLDNSSVLNLTHNQTSGAPDGGQIEFRWDTKAGAEFYELEWVHINNYVLPGETPLTESQLNYNFYMNSTRIETKQNWYKIPRIFDRGYIIYRVRPIGRNGVNFADRQDGTWSNTAESGTIATFFAVSPANKISISTEYSETNWSHNVVYTEDGKRFEGVSYADGLGRGHQSVGYNPVTNQVLVSNVYYDELGRAAVGDLPTPVDGAWMKFRENFNRAEGTGATYSWHSFDVPLLEDCEANSAGFALTDGAGKYYSPANTNQNGANVAIPDAEKFPFSRTVFTNDFTNRVASVSAAGVDLKSGSGKETKIFYPSTNQTELTQLFGSEVGYAKHYQKMITVDPNGQIYVQYSDMAGRTVASYMEGPAPTNTDGIQGNSSVPLLVTMLDEGEPQTVNTLVPYSELSYYQYISSDTTFNFNYSFTAAQFQSACTGNLCLDCVYDLHIAVFDNCGVAVPLTGYTNPVHMTGSEINSIINGTCTETEVHTETFSAHLTPGMYTIHKKLTVNEEASDQYWCLYLEANTCIESVQSIFDEAYEEESFAACDPQPIAEELLPMSECDGLKQMMLSDVSPGGQYGKYGPGFNPTDEYSVYYPSGQLGINWRSLTYLDENSVPIASGTLAGSLGLGWFVTNFRDEWAEQLLEYHPEFCYLEFCYANASSNEYDDEMLAINSYETALSEGYMMPLAGGVPNSNYTFFPTTMPSNPDPFFLDGALGENYADDMVDQLNTYINLDGFTPLSMWEYALYLVAGEGCRKNELATCMELNDCNKDQVWLTFRSLYLQDKATMVFTAQQAYALANGCSNACIGKKSPACAGIPGELSAREPRFGNLSQFASTTTNPTSQADSEIELNSIIAESCSTSCEGYADMWLEDLAACAPIASLTPTEREALRDEFIELCMLGCDKDHPMGATTAPPGETTSHGKTDIAGVLLYHLGSDPGYPSPECSEYLVSFPGPYKTITELQAGLPVMDQCGCDILMDVRADYQTAIANSTIPANTPIESFLFTYKGIQMDDIDHLLCICDEFYDEANSTWLPGANEDIIAENKYVPQELTCTEKAGCKTCDDVNTAYSDAYDYADNTLGLDAAAFEAASNYETVLTNFLNNALGFDLTFMDYDFFHRGCNTTSANPVCEMNPIMTEFRDVLKLLSMRGQLVHPTNLNLTAENIVYEHGKLREDGILGATFSSSVSSGHLNMSFQSGAGTPCTFDISIAGSPSFDFTKIVSFGEIWPTSDNCTANNSFEIEVKYYECGQLVTKIAQATSSCMQVNFCFCGDNGQLLCDEPLFDPEFEICYQPRLDNMMQDAIEAYETSVAEAYTVFKEAYKTQCATAFDTEHFDMQGSYRFYQYTLFYYDQAGNLVKTVAPKGVNKLNPTDVNTAYANMEDVTGVSTAVTALTPVQEFITTYKYNSYNQPVATENPDQEGKTEFWYDFYGRIILSQNPQQAAANKYSYIFYDKLGRPEEAGQVVPATALTSINIKLKEPLAATFRNWVTAGGSTRSEVTKTYYDKAAMTSVQSKFTLQPGQTAPGQQNLRLRVASVVYYNSVTGILSNATPYASATHYTYDIHGNVLQTLQDVPELALAKQDIKSTEYEFELVSGNVKTVKYQKDQLDQSTHTYYYDKLNRLEEVFVSTDKVHQSRQAHYLYYDYGPLSRVEIGEQKVQGMDYAYTINGWMKAMNGTILNPGYELGRDNASGYLSENTSVHNKFARDVVGYTLGYFEDDYQSIGSTNFNPSPYGNTTFDAAISPLYNGNIAFTTTAIADVPGAITPMAIQMGLYRYDQLNRLVSARTFRATGLAASNSWSGITETPEYKSTYSYDQNGNLQSLNRNGISADLNLDQFTYKYVQNSNRLTFVDDDSPVLTNYGDIKTGQTGTDNIAITNTTAHNTDNYRYDKLGQLTGDTQEGMSIEWFSGSRKVKKITRTDKIIEFKYNPFGQRIIKKVNDLTLGTVTTSYYAYDANGQVMGVYDVNLTSNNASLNELNIYGASRIGMIDKEVVLCTAGTAAAAPVYPATDPVIHILGYKKYEITNYLGNVNAVISDRKIYTSGTYVAVMLMNSDYYPFGMQMPGRHKDEDKYRFGYNGMEKDDEVKNHSGSSYTTEFRQYDPRLGRWLSLDPLMSMFPDMSPYVAFDNNPIFYTDPLGLAAEGDPIRVKMAGEKRDQKSETEYAHKLEGVEDGQILIFEYDQKSDNSKVEYGYKYNKNANQWSISYSHRRSDRAPVNESRGLVNGSINNKSPKTPENLKKTQNVINGASNASGGAQTLLEHTEKISTGPDYNLGGGTHTGNEYFKDSDQSLKRLYNSDGSLRKKSIGARMYKNISYVDNVFGTFGKVADVSEIGYHIAQGNIGKATEKLIIFGADQIADRLLMTPTPATIALGVVIKGALFIYENWDQFKAFFGPRKTPFMVGPAPRPPGGIYQDNLEKEDVVPYSSRIPIRIR